MERYVNVPHFLQQQVQWHREMVTTTTRYLACATTIAEVETRRQEIEDGPVGEFLKRIQMEIDASIMRGF